MIQNGTLHGRAWRSQVVCILRQSAAILGCASDPQCSTDLDVVNLTALADRKEKLPS